MIFPPAPRRRTLTLIASLPHLAQKLFEARALLRILGLIRQPSPVGQCSALHVLASLALASEAAAQHLHSAELLEVVLSLCHSPNDDVRAGALEALGNLGFLPANRRALLATPGVKAHLQELATSPRWAERKEGKIRRLALRTLAVLGQNGAVRACLSLSHAVAPGRGLRVLSLDGGGMRGLATVRMLRELERSTGKRMHALFDLICGTSTGGVLAVALGVQRWTLDQCEKMYRDFGSQVFSPQSSAAVTDESTWQQRLDGLYSTTRQRVRVAVHGCKHDAATFERLVRESCEMPHDREPALIDAAPLGGPAVFLVAALVTVNPPQPYVFRTYQHPLPGPHGEHPPHLHGQARAVPLGSCKHKLWHAVRASSAAPYYLADFSHGQDRWQDGAIVANNPVLFALQEAALLWPEERVATVVSVGTGTVVIKPREISSYLPGRVLDAGSVLVESALDVLKADSVMRAVCGE